MLNKEQQASLDNLNKHFRYKSDYKYWDNGKFMSPEDYNMYGDCEDYSVHVARYVLGDGRLKTFYKKLWKGNFELWFVEAQGGGGHCILIDTVNSVSIDNWTKHFISVEKMGELHTLKFKLPFPLVTWMLFAGVVEGGVRKMFGKE